MPPSSIGNGLFCIATLDLPYISLDLPQAGLISQDRINYCVVQLRNCIPSFVLHNRALFIHPLSRKDRLPSIYQDALRFAVYTCTGRVPTRVQYFRC